MTSDDPLASIKANEGEVKQLAERTDAIGATSRVLLAYAHDINPVKDDVEASWFGLDVGDDETMGMTLESSLYYTGPRPEPDQLSQTVDRVLAETPE